MTCRLLEGGQQKCQLGSFCKRVELRGAPLSLIAKGIKQRYLGNEIYTKSQHDIMIIDESPGFEDDNSRVDLSFQSQAGTKFIQYCIYAGIDPSKVWATYTVKCSPPKGRKPNVNKELAACRQYVEDEIKLIKPKVIILTGNLSYRLFNLHNEGGALATRGSVFRKPLPADEDGPIYMIIPTIRPSMFIFKEDPALEARVIDDFRMAVKCLEDPMYIPPKYEVKYDVLQKAQDIDQAIEDILESKFFAFDTESRGLLWYKEPLIMIQISYRKGEEIKTLVIPWLKTVPETHPGRLDPWLICEVWSRSEKTYLKDKLKLIFEDPEISKAAHNAKYDCNVIRKHTGLVVKGFIYDPMVMHHLLWEIKPHGLKELADIEFKCGDWEKSVADIVGHGDDKKPYDTIPMNIFIPYAAADPYWTLKLTELYQARLKKKPHLWNLYVEESEPNIHSLMVAEWNGTLIDANVVKRQMTVYQEKMETLSVECKQLTWPEFNPASPDDVAKAFVQLGFEKQVRNPTSSKGYTTNKKTLLEIPHPLAEKVLQFRSSNKLVSTYFTRALEEIDYTGRFHPVFLQHGTETGRPSASLVHQIPKLDDKLVKLKKEQPRHMFTVPLDYVYTYGDFKQIELFVFALVANDKNLLKILENNQDLHAISAATFLGMSLEEFKTHPFYDFNRTEVGKRLNFGIAYGSEGHSLVKTGKWKDEYGHEHSITWAMLDRGMEQWKRQFPGVGDYLDTYPDLVRQNNGIAITVFGRERRFGSRLWDKNEQRRKKAEREAVNFTIQSPANALTNRTINIMHSILQERIEANDFEESDVFFVNTVHDSIAYEVRKWLTDWAKQTILICATREVPEFNGYRFQMDIGVGNSWAEAEISTKKKGIIMKTEELQ